MPETTAKTQPKLTDYERAVLRAVIDETARTGTPPTLRRLDDLCGDIPKGSIPHVIRGLERKGYLVRAGYHGGPVKPLRAEDGRLVVISVEIAP